MMRATRPSLPAAAAQRGAALFTALIMLIALTIISLASLGTSLLELRMANNTEAGISAFQSAQSAIDNVIFNDTANFVITGDLNNTNCTTNADGTCDARNVELPVPFVSNNQVTITRTSDSGCPPADLETSCSKSKAASFDIYSKYDRSALGQGRAELNQGYVKLFPCVAGNCGTNTETALHN